VESLIKQFNQSRRAGKRDGVPPRRDWNQGGAECVLQIHAAYLNEDDRGERFHEQRPRGRAVGRNRKKLAA
jgi:hypothetical protein